MKQHWTLKLGQRERVRCQAAPSEEHGCEAMQPQRLVATCSKSQRAYQSPWQQESKRANTGPAMINKPGDFHKISEKRGQISQALQSRASKAHQISSHGMAKEEATM